MLLQNFHSLGGKAADLSKVYIAWNWQPFKALLSIYLLLLALNVARLPRLNLDLPHHLLVITAGTHIREASNRSVRYLGPAQ